MPLNKKAQGCVENTRSSKITVSEKGKSVTFLNPDRKLFKKIRVDNCVVNLGPRADWIISKTNDVSVIIELKGRNVDHALEQIFATFAHKDCSEWLGLRVKLLIICAKYPSFDTKIAKAQDKARRLGTTLKIVCRSLECDVGQV
jgi:hypothetical protein